MLYEICYEEVCASAAPLRTRVRARDDTARRARITRVLRQTVVTRAYFILRMRAQRR